MIKVHFMRSDEPLPIPTYITRPRQHQVVKNAHITDPDDGEILTARLSTGEVLVAGPCEMVELLRLRGITADDLAMPYKNEANSPHTGQG
jgi:hypothetical protein